MISREDFKKVWKDSSREDILNQFYYEHYKLFRIQKEISKCIDNITLEKLDDFEKHKMISLKDTLIGKTILEILDSDDTKM